MGTTELFMKNVIKKTVPAIRRQSYVKLIFSILFMSEFQISSFSLQNLQFDPCFLTMWDLKYSGY